MHFQAVLQLVNKVCWQAVEVIKQHVLHGLVLLPVFCRRDGPKG